MGKGNPGRSSPTPSLTGPFQTESPTAQHLLMVLESYGVRRREGTKERGGGG